MRLCSVKSPRSANRADEERASLLEDAAAQERPIRACKGHRRPAQVISIGLTGAACQLALHEKNGERVEMWPQSLECIQAQEERNGLLEDAAEKGHVSGITGWRRSLKGTRFQARLIFIIYYLLICCCYLGFEQTFSIHGLCLPNVGCLGCGSCEDASYPSYRFDSGFVQLFLLHCSVLACISGRQLIEKRSLPGALSPWGLPLIIR